MTFVPKLAPPAPRPFPTGCSIDHLRPEGRIKKDPGNWSSAAQLEPDKTAFWLNLPPGTTDLKNADGKDVVIAVEVKPKGAVMPVGTLVPPGNNRLKYRVARFDAQQKFKAQGKQSWGSIDRVCAYHPREFYSGEAGRAAATLKELMKTPQNKLRAWENGNMLFGAGSGQSDEVAEGVETAGEVKLGAAVVTAGLAGGSGWVALIFHLPRKLYEATCLCDHGDFFLFIFCC